MADWDEYSALPNENYFVNNTSAYNADRKLYQRLLSEAYNKFGIQFIYYVSTFDTSYDSILGEDTNRKFTRKFDFMGHCELPQNEQLWTSFGIEGMDEFNVYVSKYHFKEASKDSDNYSSYVPRNGDVIYLKYNSFADQTKPKTEYYEIVNVSEEENQFLQEKHVWILRVRPFVDKYISLSADTSATMTDISAITDQDDDLFDISDVIDRDVSGNQYNDTGTAPDSIWGEW